MKVRIGSTRGTGQIAGASTDNDAVLVIEFHARATNGNATYVGMSDVGINNGRELAPGEAFALNFALPDAGDHRGSMLINKFYVLTTGGDTVDWAAIIRGE